MTEQPDYFKTFCKISKAFGTALSTEKLLDLIVESAIESMRAKAACLFLADEEKDIFVPVAQKGLSENYLHAKPLQAKQLVSAILKGGYLYIQDATSDPRVEHHDVKKAEGIASILDVPVMLRDKAIGVLALYTAAVRTFNADEIEFLSALAEQGGMAVERARLLDRIQSNSALFLQLTSSINSSLDIKHILHILTADISKAFGMKSALIRLINETTGTLDLVGSWGLSDEFLNKGPVYAEKSLSEALQGKTVVIEDVAGDRRLQYRQALIDEGILSMLSVPIKSKSEVIGVMRLFSALKRKFPEDMVMLLEALAHAGALAIQNASMYLKLQHDKESLEKDIWSHRSWF
jgi:GAF domain-containing protein